MDNPIHLIRNGLDDDLVYASDSVASNNVPDWMNNQPDIDGTGYKSGNEIFRCIILKKRYLLFNL